MSLRGILRLKVGLPLIIQKSTQTQSVGEPIRTWATHVLEWWAQKLPRGGSEGQAGGQEAYATRNHSWLGLWVEGVHEGMRLLENGIVYDINVVDDTGRLHNALILHTTQNDTVP